MTESPPRPRRQRVLLLLAVVVGVVVVVATYGWARAKALDAAGEAGRQRLGLYASTIRNALDRFSYLPATIAIDRDVLELLEHPDPARVDDINRRLERINVKARSAALYLMDASGTTLAASNWNTPTSYVGADYSFRPYFIQVMGGGAGHFFGIGVTTKLPGYFLASAVLDREDRIVGAVVVKIDLEGLEKEWAEANEKVLVTDENAITILASRPEWKYTIDGRLDPPLQAVLNKTQRYGEMAIRPLNVGRRQPLTEALRLTVIDGVPYVVQSEPYPEEGWTIHYLIGWDETLQRVRGTAALAGIAWVAMVLLLLYLRQRRIANRARQEASEELERTVALRTQALSAEIAERQRTERELRGTQDELIHAGKMAALGQMSAAIAHELNQPLAAIQTFIASSRIFLERVDLKTVAANLVMVEDLGNRMAQIIRHLRIFARKSPAERVAVDLSACVERALLLLDAPLRLGQVVVERRLLPGCLVRGDQLRLEQVFVNLIRNALDSLAGAATKRLELEMVRDGDTVVVRVADSGGGIPPEALSRMFEPFFTTKDVGEGLGLGLSLSYAIVADMGGAIHADNRPEGGAVFTITLAADGVMPGN